MICRGQERYRSVYTCLLEWQILLVVHSLPFKTIVCQLPFFIYLYSHTAKYIETEKNYKIIIT